uniref:Uncharacterized protein n=1 Tax=Rhizophora mucronata TaxID=61149 RepID=A0A2P2JJ91_RHIMU
MIPFPWNINFPGVLGHLYPTKFLSAVYHQDKTSLDFPS